jgi:hypothetical protein
VGREGISEYGKHKYERHRHGDLSNQHVIPCTKAKEENPINQNRSPSPSRTQHNNTRQRRNPRRVK